MATISQNRRVESASSMARFSIDEDDEEVPTVVGRANKRPRFSGPGSQSQPRSQPQRPVQQTQPVQRSQSERRSVWDEDEFVELIEVQEGDSDPQGSEEEDDVEILEEEEQGEDIGSDDDEEAEAHAVSEGQNQHQQVTDYYADSEELQIADLMVVGAALRSCSTAAPVFNNDSGALAAVLTDPDVFDCPICLDPLCTPIFQCENGHIACSSCCPKINRKCPSCCMPIGYNRCRAIEKVVESLIVSCKNTPSGCQETTIYSKKNEHEQTCPHEPCFCPHSSCTFSAPSKDLYFHFSRQHTSSSTRFTFGTTISVSVKKSQRHVILQEQHESVIFVLNHDVQEHGRVFSVDCIGPNSLKGEFSYKLTAKCMKTSLSLHSKPEMWSKWSEHAPAKTYLTVPFDFSGSGGLLSILVCIKRARLVRV